MNDILKRVHQQTIIPEDLARFLQLPPYDNDIQINQKIQEQDFIDNETKYVLEHAPCISISDHWPWNNDNRGKIFISNLIFNSNLYFRNFYGFCSFWFNAFNV